MRCGDSCRESAAAPGQRRTPSWTYEGEERKKKQGEMNGVGGGVQNTRAKQMRGSGGYL
ncbi:hypothetical protein [Candidatus Ichthyocystis sparus]|uniref:hypothetical protein n=1 Tax=Candidatus Ichthyocystis sparus TaxID=1561004 RepID=UPI00159ECCFD|nr:hypothetical protein [Candidatus Ichthyocystis sparus]